MRPITNNHITARQAGSFFCSRIYPLAERVNRKIKTRTTKKIKAIVEFLGPRLPVEELSKMWNLQDSPNSHVMDNVYAIMAGAAAKFSLAQFEHLTGLIKEKWSTSNDRVREKLLALIGQIGREAKQIKSTQVKISMPMSFSKKFIAQDYKKIIL